MNTNSKNIIQIKATPEDSKGLPKSITKVILGPSDLSDSKDNTL